MPDCRIACGKLRTTSGMLSCGWAGRQRLCSAALSFTIMLHWLLVKFRLIGYSCVMCYKRTMTCAFFTNLARLKFPYENHLVEISRESYENLVYERCPNCNILSHSLWHCDDIIIVIIVIVIIVIIVIDFEMENIEKHVLSTENLINAYRYQNEELLWNPDLNAKRVKRTDVDEA